MGTYISVIGKLLASEATTRDKGKNQLVDTVGAVMRRAQDYTAVPIEIQDGPGGVLRVSGKSTKGRVAFTSGQQQVSRRRSNDFGGTTQGPGQDSEDQISFDALKSRLPSSEHARFPYQFQNLENWQMERDSGIAGISRRKLLTHGSRSLL